MWTFIWRQKIIIQKTNYPIKSYSITISRINNSVSRDICKLRQSFLPDRIKNYWNSLPVYVKSSENVINFKINLDKFKNESVDSCSNKFWEFSNLIIDQIEGNPNYLINKNKFNNYLLENPFVAKRKGINIYAH